MGRRAVNFAPEQPLSKDTRVGWFGIGVYNLKNCINLGNLWRSAYCLGAAYVFTVGARIKRTSCDTCGALSRIPYLRYVDSEDFLAHIPFDCQLVGVEIGEFAKPLETYPHPPRAVYILGPEDGMLPRAIRERARATVQFESRFCLNVATAGAVVMYDRRQKAHARRSELSQP